MTAKTFELGPGYTISRVIRGGWQLAGGHGAIDREQAVTDLITTFDAGIWTYDCADIYTGVEELIGAARLRLASERGLDAAARMKVHTKLVPDLERLASISRDYIRGIVDQSLRRLKTERLDLVQFHWWDYAMAGYIDAMGWLNELRLEGKVRNARHHEFRHATPCRDHGAPACRWSASNCNIPCSTSGRRARPCRTRRPARHQLPLLRFGGRRLPQRPMAWLAGAADAARKPLAHQIQADHRRFRWLGSFPGICSRRCGGRRPPRRRHRHHRQCLGAGAAASRRRHRRRPQPGHALANAGIMDIALTPDDKTAIGAVIAESRGLEGDIYTLERDRHGRHGSIMHYNLNAGRVMSAQSSLSSARVPRSSSFMAFSSTGSSKPGRRGGFQPLRGASWPKA